MAHSFVANYVHYIFSTKQRRSLITEDIRERLWAYMGGIARENRMQALAIGGTENHAHLLVSLPSTLSVAKAIQAIKGGSSLWVSEQFACHHGFAWQEGYGAFSVSMSMVGTTIAYIVGQQEHHASQTFEQEYLAFLDKYGIEYTPEYVFD